MGEEVKEDGGEDGGPAEELGSVVGEQVRPRPFALG